MSFKIKIGLLSISVLILFYFAFFDNKDNEIIHVKLDDKDLIIQNRLFSPNKKFVVFSYIFDSGALGYTRLFHSISETKDTLKQINQFEIPCIDFPQCYHPIEWKNDSTLVIETKLADYTYYGIKIDTLNFTPKEEILKWRNINIICKFYRKN